MGSFNVMFYQQSVILLHVKCRYRDKAIPIGFSEAVWGLFPVHKSVLDVLTAMAIVSVGLL
jgi:hypothetical protein